LVGMEYDPTRKLNKLTQLRSCTDTSIGNAVTAYAPVPYNINFMVYVMTKTQDDALQIVEQIIPYFTPQYVVTVNLIPQLGIVQDIPFTLNGVDINDSFEGPVENRREIVYTLSFTAKTEFLGPINTGSNVILQTRADVITVDGDGDRRVATNVSGTLSNYQIVDNYFDIINQPPAQP
jgi:hypothetical protein